MEANNQPDKELIKRHNNGKIIILAHNKRNKDRYLIPLEITKHLYLNQQKDKYYLCKVDKTSKDYDFAIVLDPIEGLAENETLQDKVFFPECLLELKVFLEMTEKAMVNNLMYEVCENLAFCQTITGESERKLLEKYKQKMNDFGMGRKRG